MQNSHIIFRHAIPTDINDIISINDSYLNLNSKNGFLITTYDTKTLLGKINTNPDCIYVCTYNSEIIGFVEISFKLDNEVIDTLNWHDLQFKKIFNENNTLYVEKIAIKKGFKKRNIGKRLYELVFQKYPDTLLYSFIVNKPYNNASSLEFHKKLNFTECAVFNAENFMGIKNYESLLYIKL